MYIKGVNKMSILEQKVYLYETISKLPEDKVSLFFDFAKNLTDDAFFDNITDVEHQELLQIKNSMDNGDYISHNAVDWE